MGEVTYINFHIGTYFSVERKKGFQGAHETLYEKDLLDFTTKQ